MDIKQYFKELLSIEEKRVSLLGILLIIVIGYSLYSHYTEKDISSLVIIIEYLLIAFAGINAFSIIGSVLDYKNKFKELGEVDNIDNRI